MVVPTRRRVMRHLTVYQRLSTIIAVLSITLLAVSVMQILVLRDAVLEERRTTVHDLVDAATRILNFYDAEAKAGKIEPEMARHMAFTVIGAIRWGQYSDYIGIYGTGSTDAGVTYVHSNPKYINVNRWVFLVSSGFLLFLVFVCAVRSGGGFVEYMAPRSGGGAEQRKLAYVGAFGAGDKLLAIQAGVYVDDIDAVVYQRALWSGVGGFAGLLFAGLVALRLGRGIVEPLDKTCEVMVDLTRGNLSFDVPFADQKNEVGRMARGLQDFKDHLAENERLRAEQEMAKLRSSDDRRAVLARISDDF